MEMEKVSLWFQPGGKQEGFRWQASYQNKAVGLCNQPFCDICNLSEREKLRGFRGGKLEVQLILHRRPSFWEERQFYLGHLISVPAEKEIAVIDEGLEFDISRLNAVIYTTTRGAVLVDPGSMGFESEGTPLKQLIAGQRIMATVISHGHLDHWNHLGEMRGHIFMTQLAFQLASRHAYWQRDFQLTRALRGAKMVVPGEPIFFEQNFPLRIDTISLPHSIPETVGLVIKGERARVVHLGDFKFNGMDPKVKAVTIAQFSEIAKERVDLLVLNIINAHIPGFTPLEGLMIETLTDIIARAKGRVIVACFSTNLERIRRIVEVSQLLGRPVQFFGAGMQNSRELLSVPAEERYPDKAVIFVTGCQAEEDSVLWRIAQGQNFPFQLRLNDVLVSSARCIPGNEEPLRQQYIALRPKVERVVVNEGEIEQVGLNGLDIEEAQTHFSGHESGGGLQFLLEIFQQPNLKVLAWPQTEPQIGAFRKIAEKLGVEILPETERIIEI